MLVYKLIVGSDLGFYIGQTTRSAQIRLKEHKSLLSKGKHHSPKLQKAYNKDNTLRIEILERATSLKDLNILEQAFLDLYKEDSRLLNNSSIATNPLSDPEVSKRVSESKAGHKNYNAKHSEEVYLDIFEEAICCPQHSYSKIASKHNTTYSIVSQVCSGQSHSIRLIETFGEELYYEALQELKTLRKSSTADKRTTRIEYPPVVSPAGEIFEINNMASFCKEHELDPGNMAKLCKGARKTHKGWKALGESKVKLISLKDPDGQLHQNISNVSEFCIKHNLCSSNINAVIRGAKKSYKGWTLTD